MITDKTWKLLVDLHNSEEYGPNFFRSLARMKATKGPIDIVRRMQDVNKRDRLKLSLETAVSFYRRLAALGLASDNTEKVRGKNPSIIWLEGSIRCNELAHRVLEIARSGRIEQAIKAGGAVTFVTEAGETILLSRADVLALKKKLKDWL